MTPDASREWHLFRGALGYYTRLPPPFSVHERIDITAVSRYLPLVGWIVGGLSGLVAALAAGPLGLPLATLLGLTSGLLLTGALHEDGFADTCDGFGGGWTPQRILDIMKDSRLGTYGVVGLILLLLLKAASLMALDAPHVWGVWVAGHAWSRFLAIEVSSHLPYLRSGTQGKAAGLSRLHPGALGFAFLTGALPLLIGWGLWGLGILGLTWILQRLGIRYLRQRLGGITGDCLGGVQQLAELGIYLLLVGGT